jgi:hypothetical protein
MKRIGCVVIALALAACSGGGHPTAESTSSTAAPAASPTTSTHADAGPQLPPAAAHWLRRHFKVSPIGRATSADWVRSTRGQAAEISEAVPSDTTPVFVFDVHGHFSWNHSCRANTSDPSACVSVGTHEVFTVDSRRLEILDFGVQQQPPNLAQFGPVGHFKF